MSSIVDRNIIQHCISNRRTITIYHDLSIGNTFTVDLTHPRFGSLDFKADIVRPVYFTYVSKNNHTYDEMAVITCNFIREGEILMPFYAITSHESYNGLKYTCKQQMDRQNVKFEIKMVNGDLLVPNTIYNSGTIMVALQFTRFRRVNESF